MGCMLLFPGKHFLTNDIMSGNPSKKIRLELPSRNERITGNEDLWGQDDLTAEEFDILEIQATQSCNETVSFPNHNATVNNCKYNNGPSTATQIDDLKQQQYELEGRIKILSLSLEKVSKELNEERLNRENMIKERMKEFCGRECNLQKEIEKIKSVLEFKEQEMKSVYSKLQVLKSQIPDKKRNCAETFMNKDFEDFLTSYKSTKNQVQVSYKLSSANKFHRKNKLLVDSPRGKSESIDDLATILCNRLAVPFYKSSKSLTKISHVEQNMTNFSFTPISIVQLKNEHLSDELIEYYKSVLQQHVQYLKTLANKGITNNTSKSSPLSSRRKDANSISSLNVISCLRDVAFLLSSPKAISSVPKCGGDKIMPCDKEEGESSTSHSKAHIENIDNPESRLIDNQSKILKSLIALSNPSTFPNGYSNTEEIELSLSALLNICISCPEMFLANVSVLPIHSLLNPHQSATSICTALKLIISLSGNEMFTSHLAHKDSLCLLCSVAAFLCNTVHQYPDKFSVSMILVEDFLSSVFLVHNLTATQLETSPCISEILKGVVACIWKYYQLKKLISCSTVIIKKGFFLLHFMSTCISNFKEKRNQVEDEYISLVSNLLTLSKENSDFRELYDLIHNLWDFQTDISEFDSDEPSDETQTPTNDMDITE